MAFSSSRFRVQVLPFRFMLLSLSLHFEFRLGPSFSFRITNTLPTDSSEPNSHSSLLLFSSFRSSPSFFASSGPLFSGFFLPHHTISNSCLSLSLSSRLSLGFSSPHSLLAQTPLKLSLSSTLSHSNFFKFSLGFPFSGSSSSSSLSLLSSSSPFFSFRKMVASLLSLSSSQSQTQTPPFSQTTLSYKHHYMLQNPSRPFLLAHLTTQAFPRPRELTHICSNEVIKIYFSCDAWVNELLLYAFQFPLKVTKKEIENDVSCASDVAHDDL